MDDRLVTIDMGRKVGALGGCCALFWGDRRRSEAVATAGTSSDVEWSVIASLIITLKGKR